jgi:hypothetical protein
MVLYYRLLALASHGVLAACHCGETLHRAEPSWLHTLSACGHVVLVGVMSLIFLRSLRKPTEDAE